jgi:deoxyribodipyrimidine photo-lyase
MGCVEIALDELEEDGWLVGEARWWLAARWVASGRPWSEGDDHLHRHLLDGSRAGGRLSWRQATGLDGVAAPEVSRWDVERHAPGLCATCELVHRCPIEDSADRIHRELGLAVADGPPTETLLTDTLQTDAGPAGPRPDDPAPIDPAIDEVSRLLAGDPDPETTAGPRVVVSEGRAEAVWLTAESMGDTDPALASHPDLPVLFVFDEPLLLRLRLSAKRLVFLVETLADLGRRRSVGIALGDPVQLLSGRQLATTFAPVPGWRRRSSRLDLAVLHPWPWLHRPHGAGMATYLEWLAGVELQRELGRETQR